MRKTITEVLVNLASIACILVWLGVKPADLAAPRWLWLAAGIVLFGISLVSSLRSYVLTSKRVPELERRVVEEMSAKENREGRLNELRMHYENLQKQSEQERTKEMSTDHGKNSTPSPSWVRFLTAYPVIAGPPDPGKEQIPKPQKARCEFLNSADVAYKVKVIKWESGSRGLDADVWPGSIQLRIQGKWYPDWIDGGELHVAPGEQFRFWAFPKDTLTNEQFEARVNAGNLGTVHLLINGKEVAVVVG